jgi:hypothetical protein
MTASDFIPAGRTSLVKQGKTALQVQTEYAPRPNPRITTTVSKDGQVMHKIERGLNQAVTSPEEQSRAESTLVRQHKEIIGIIEKKAMATAESPATLLLTEVAPDVAEARSVGSVYERLEALPGVKRVYRTDNEGQFAGVRTSEHFRKAFGPIFKSLPELINLFARVPGVGFTRQQGVYEVTRDRLYLVSEGLECFFVVVDPVCEITDYEAAIRKVIAAPG